MALKIIRTIVYYLNYFFLWYLIIYSTYILICSLYGIFKMYRYRKLDNLHNILEHDFYYPMSIIVPAYNESTSIVQTIENLLLLDYKLYEIIVVDDGSKDNTKQLVVDTFGLRLEEGRPIQYVVPCKPINEVYSGKVNNVKIVLASKENGGCKADASNAGINLSSYPYIVNMDADEILQRDSLKYASRAILEDENVVCVGGNIKMSNSVSFKDAMPVETKMGKNLVVDMQVLEYGRAFVGSRILQNDAKMNLIVSGGYGVFKKSVLVEVGGYDTTSMGEDMELTVRIHKHFRKNKKPYVMKYVPDSVCWTQGPDNMHDLRKQRERWYCGLMQTIKKYKSMIFNPKYGLIGMFMFPYMIIYELLNPFTVLIGWFVIGWTLFDASINVPFVLYVALMYFAFGVFLSMISYIAKAFMKQDKLSFKKIIISFFVSIIDAVFFRLYLSLVAFMSIFKVKKIAKKWVSPKRVVVETNNK